MFIGIDMFIIYYLGLKADDKIGFFLMFESTHVL